MPVQDGGHEVLVFRHKGKLYSLTSPHGPAGSRLLSADDPREFHLPFILTHGEWFDQLCNG